MWWEQNAEPQGRNRFLLPFKVEIIAFFEEYKIIHGHCEHIRKYREHFSKRIINIILAHVFEQIATNSLCSSFILWNHLFRHALVLPNSMKFPDLEAQDHDAFLHGLAGNHKRLNCAFAIGQTLFWGPNKYELI